VLLITVLRVVAFASFFLGVASCCSFIIVKSFKLDRKIVTSTKILFSYAWVRLGAAVLSYYVPESILTLVWVSLGAFAEVSGVTSILG
jgi:hypothetical protein